MFDDLIGWIVAGVLGKLFKGRPLYAFLAFAGLVAASLGVLLFRAQGSNEFGFALFGLVFVMIVVLPHVLHKINQDMIRDMQASDTTLPEIEEGIQETGDTFELEEPINEIESAP